MRAVQTNHSEDHMARQNIKEATQGRLKIFRDLLIAASNNIDEIDMRLVDLLTQRSKWCLEVCSLKMKLGAPIVRPDIELKRFRRVSRRAKLKGYNSPQDLVAIWRFLIALSKSDQMLSIQTKSASNK